MNGLKTALLLGSMSGLILLIGSRYGEQGLMLSFVMAVAMNFFSYFFSAKIALWSSGAQPLSEGQHPQIYRRVEPLVRQLAGRMGLPMPKLYVTPEPSPNAFATGRNPANAAVAVTAGLLEVMNDDELAGVLAHELGHVKNRDILISCIAATLASVITMVARMAYFFGGRSSDDDNRSSGFGGLAMLIVAPILAMLIQMAISRTREYSADAAAARAMGSGQPLASALSKLENWSHRVPMEASPAMSHMYIMKPHGLWGLFSTHPPTQERIARLRALVV